MAKSIVEVLTIDEAESRGWNEMVSVHPLGTVFHHTAYAKVIRDTFNHMVPYYVTLFQADGTCCGGIVLFLVKSWLTGNRLVSIPWAAYCDPLVRTSEEFKQLFSKALELSKQVKASYIEINSRDSNTILKQANLMTLSHYHNAHFLDTTKDTKTLWNELSRSLRNRIQKAEKNGVKVRLANSELDVVSFYQVWCGHRKILGLPAHRFEYFRNMWRYLVSQGMAQFWIAEKKGEVLSGLCSFVFKQKVFCAYIAEKRTCRHLGGAKYVLWKAISSASEDGISIVDFGKTPIGSNSLKVYKDQWGVQEMETPVFYYPSVKGVSSYQDEKNLSYRAMRYFWKVAPPRLSQVASKFFWRHTG